MNARSFRCEHNWRAKPPDRIAEQTELVSIVKLFMLILERDGTRDAGFDVVVHAADAETARAHVAPRFVGYTMGKCIELADVTRHFVVTEWDSD